MVFFNETTSNQSYEGVRLITVVNSLDNFGISYIEVEFFILESILLQMLLSVIHQTHAFSFDELRYLTPKRDDLNVGYWLVLFEGFE